MIASLREHKQRKWVNVNKPFSLFASAKTRHHAEFKYIESCLLAETSPAPQDHQVSQELGVALSKRRM